MESLLSSVNPVSLIGDAVVLLIVVLAIIRGIRKGFLGLIVGFLSGIVTIIVASLLCKPVANLIGGWGLRGALSGFFADTFGLSGGTPIKEIAADGASAAIANLNLPLPKFVIDSITAKVVEAIGSSSIPADATLQSIVLDGMVSVSLLAISWILLVLVLGILFFILKRFVKVFNNIPLIGTANKILGALLSVLLALVAICAVTYLFVLISAFLPKGVIDFVNGSPTLSFLYNTNPIGYILTKIFQ